MTRATRRRAAARTPTTTSRTARASASRRSWTRRPSRFPESATSTRRPNRQPRTPPRAVARWSPQLAAPLCPRAPTHPARAPLKMRSPVPLVRDPITPAPTATDTRLCATRASARRSQAKQIATPRSPDAVFELWLPSRLCSASLPRSASSRAARPCRPMPRALASRPWRCARPSLAAIGASRCGDGPEAGRDNPRTLVGR